MVKNVMAVLTRTVAVSFLVLLGDSAGIAQQRYEPSRPTVSPYLNLFQNNRNNRNGRSNNSAVPNYYSLVRPLQQQYQTNQIQQQLLQQQGNALGQLQGNVQQLQKEQQTGPLVAPTGHSGWFNNPGTRATFQNTSRYYQRAGTGGAARQ